MKIKTLFPFCFVFIIFIDSCADNTAKKYKKEYYPSGKIKTIGWYIKDSIPVDTLFNFFKSGKLSSKEVYDSIGNAVQSTSYYENGIMSEEINYTNGLANGFGYVFNELGNIEQKKFHINDSFVGDAFFFVESSSIDTYAFYDWTGQNINLIQYDSLNGKIKKDMRQTIYLDSLKMYHESSQNFAELKLVISNPPYCRSTVKIDYLSKIGNTLRSDSVIGIPYYSKKIILSDSIYAIKFTGHQYDSLTKENFGQWNRKIVSKYGFTGNSH